MNYFTQDYTDFLKDLAANNDRDWFKERKKRYEQSVRDPFKAFVGALLKEIGKYEKGTADLLPKTAIYRIYRDTRFSKDKTPYKLYCSAVLSPYGRKSMDYPGTYLQFGAGEILIGGGSYMPPKEQIYHIRTAMSEDPGRVEALLAAPGFKRIYGGITGDQHKRLPKEFKALQERLPLIANKQFFYMANYTEDESILLKDDLMEFMMEHYLAAKDWLDFLRAAWK